MSEKLVVKFFKITTQPVSEKAVLFYMLDRKFSFKGTRDTGGDCEILPMKGDHFTPTYLSAFSSLLILFLTLFLFFLFKN